MATPESNSSEISSLTESEAIHPPEGTRGSMDHSTGLNSGEEEEVVEHPTPLPSAPTTRPRPGRLDAQSDEEMGRTSYPRAPKKIALKKTIIPTSIEQGKALFRDRA